MLKNRRYVSVGEHKCRCALGARPDGALRCSLPCRLLGLIKPILGDTRRNQLKGYLSAYKAGLGGRSCYRKYPCYSNNLGSGSKRGKGGKGSSSRRVEGGAGGNATVTAEALAAAADNSTFTGKSSSSETGGDSNTSNASNTSIEERIVYDLANASNETMSESSTTDAT